MLVSFSLFVLTGCVVRYGDAPASSGAAAANSAAPGPQDAALRDLEARIDALLQVSEQVDQKDRLQAAWELARKMKGQPASAQQAAVSYLGQLVAIEERSKPMDAPVLVDEAGSFTPIGTGIEVEDIDE